MRLFYCHILSLHQKIYFFFFFNDTATTEIYTLSLHDALPIYRRNETLGKKIREAQLEKVSLQLVIGDKELSEETVTVRKDRKSTRLNSSHANISYAVFCLKKKKNKNTISPND